MQNLKKMQSFCAFLCKNSISKENISCLHISPWKCQNIGDFHISLSNVTKSHENGTFCTFIYKKAESKNIIFACFSV